MPRSPQQRQDAGGCFYIPEQMIVTLATPAMLRDKISRVSLRSFLIGQNSTTGSSRTMVRQRMIIYSSPHVPRLFMFFFFFGLFE